MSRRGKARGARKVEVVGAAPRPDRPVPSEARDLGEPLHLPAARILLMAMGFALWTGLAEVAPVLLAPYVGVVIRLSRHFVWMTPLAHILMFGAVAGLLLVAGRWWPRARSRSVVVNAFTGLMLLALGLHMERLHPAAALLLAVGVGAQAGRMTRRAVRFPRMLAAFVVMGLLLVGGLTARMEVREVEWRTTWLAWLPEPPADAPNVLLLILDTVRAASLDLMGNASAGSDWPPVDTPALDSLAARSVVFTEAIAPSPWTLPSHASMFTGRWPVELWGRARPGTEWGLGLDGEYPTVAETLARGGYLTGGFVSNLLFTASETGLNRGFLDYEDYPVSVAQVFLSTAIGRRLAASSWVEHLTGYYDVPNRKSAAHVADEFLDWERRHGDRPYFAFVNFFDAHEPHFPPDSVRRAMPPGSQWDDFSRFAGLLTGVGAFRIDPWTMDPAERAAHVAGYDAGILDIDREVGRILRELEARGGLENTIVILASDHGEQLGEHGLFNHDNSLYRQALHVPLVVYDPRQGGAPLTVTERVSLRNVGATILDLVGLDPDSAGIGGRSLTAYWRTAVPATGGAPIAEALRPLPDTVLSSLARGADNQAWFPASWGPAMFSLVDSVHHYIRNGDGSEELYDTKADPGERTNVAGDSSVATVLGGFRRTMDALVPGLPPFAATPVTHPAPPASPATGGGS